MTVQEVIDRIRAYHPVIDGYETRVGAVDGAKCGDPSIECTGVVTAIAATIDVIRETLRLGYNLLYVHEPSFYGHMDYQDYLQGEEVYEEKMALLRQGNIVIYRDHDHIHAHIPDGIYEGIDREYGWKEYQQGHSKPGRPDYHVIPPTTVRELALFLKEKCNLNGIRVVGNLDGVVSKIWHGGHITTDKVGDRGSNHTETYVKKCLEDGTIDVVIPGEVIDWTLLSYFRDAGQLGKNKAMIILGHFNHENIALKWAAEWIADLIDHKLPTQYVDAGDTYQYL